MTQYKEEVVQGYGYRGELPVFNKQGEAVYFYAPARGKIVPQVPLTDELLSHHLLFLGSSGTGKTTAIKALTRQLIDQMTADDVMIVFDAKGDYLSLKRAGDIVIDNQVADNDCVVEDREKYWNLFEEISPAVLREGEIEAEINEIALTLFSNRMEKSREPFFPNAGKDVLAGLITALLREGGSELSNKTLREFLDRPAAAQIREKLNNHPDLRGITNYIAGDHLQTQGVLSEVQQVSQALFQGNFKKSGELSIRRLVRDRGKRVIFVEYDLKYGHLLGPIYKLLFDLALKEALSQGERAGRVYFILDEYRLLPNSKHLEIAANFGRSQGVKLVLGLQSVSQMYALYESRDMAESLLSGLASLVVFRLNDYPSREFVSRRLGANRKKITWMPTINNKGLQDEFARCSVVEDWDIYSLFKGEAIIALPQLEPFYFMFAPPE